MRHLTKLITAILLIMVPAVPALAAIPSQQSACFMPCCGGAMCPVMGMMASIKVTGHKGMKDMPAPCCMKNQHKLVAVVDQQMQKNPPAMVTFGASSAAAPMPQMISRRKDLTPIFLRWGPRTQAALSTFLI